MKRRGRGCLRLAPVLSLVLAFIAGSSQSLASDTRNDTPPAPAEDQQSIDHLRRGGFVFVARHGLSPPDQDGAVGMTEGCRLAEGRGLNAEGFAASRKTGEFLAVHKIPVGRVYTSRMCRSWDTAMLLAGGADVLPSDAQMTTDADAIAQFKKQIEAEIGDRPDANILLVSHSNIAPLYGAYAPAGHEEVPSGFVFIVDPSDWRAVGVIIAPRAGGPQTVTVEMPEWGGKTAR